ncbi:Predicted AAA-ATPase [uncultured Roseburia sp.]|uniref:ATP-binding protein n=1 Tax=Brotonthovivens ammoniilytica TaxID=2981725 RepID=A0ABT2TGQ6_9FIRM|nr:AAA family ATPase [Brotonthovivens ammoniilytica]MCU6761360.1 ATP-binding protein [Brotonthovivens ammoniilytica]SCI26239.1 Predicted AAA-ATPase [uncultured Roseburia sp.]
MLNTPLPIGFDDFKEIITGKYYYVDKSWFIKELLDQKAKVNLFTRPRRFGKTLNLSMLRYYFERTENKEDNRSLFDGLKIMQAGRQYTQEMGQYPVIMLTLKSAKQGTYEYAYTCLCEAIANEYDRHKMIISALEYADKDKFNRIRNQQGGPGDYLTSLAFLSKCLYTYYEKPAVILIDEYDVPLENAYYNGFYDEMICFIRSLFESALKTNPYLAFSVVTGCLRISKESVFTGLNNLDVISILNEDYDEYFGFVQKEVTEMLSFYHCEASMPTMKDWYDGYLFGQTEVYNPWSVINYIKRLLINPNSFPTAAWSNTSSNSIVKDLVYHASSEVREQIEKLMNGETIEKRIHDDITYEDIHTSEENLWNFLYFTGYLKGVSVRMDGVNRYITMAIPNKEVLYIYDNTVTNWFRDEVKIKDLSAMYAAMLKGDVAVFQQLLTQELRGTISYMDNKEAFYHGFLVGILANLKDYLVKSNREGGTGRYDICIYHLDETIPPVVIELKIARTFADMEKRAQEALNQIEEKQYDAWLPDEGYTAWIRYGIAFYKKKCMIKMERKKILSYSDSF